MSSDIAFLLRSYFVALPLVAVGVIGIRYPARFYLWVDNNIRALNPIVLLHRLILRKKSRKTELSDVSKSNISTMRVVCVFSLIGGLALLIWPTLFILGQ